MTFFIKSFSKKIIPLHLNLLKLRHWHHLERIFYFKNENFVYFNLVLPDESDRATGRVGCCVEPSSSISAGAKWQPSACRSRWRCRIGGEIMAAASKTCRPVGNLGDLTSRAQCPIATLDAVVSLRASHWKFVGFAVDVHWSSPRFAADFHDQSARIHATQTGPNCSNQHSAPKVSSSFQISANAKLYINFNLIIFHCVYGLKYMSASLQVYTVNVFPLKYNLNCSSRSAHEKFREKVGKWGLRLFSSSAAVFSVTNLLFPGTLQFCHFLY